MEDFPFTKSYKFKNALWKILQLLKLRMFESSFILSYFFHSIYQLHVEKNSFFQFYKGTHGKCWDVKISHLWK